MPWSAPAPGHRRLSRFTTGRRALRAGATATTVAAMLCTYIVVVVTRADAAETLLSQGKPTTASSTENVGTPASNATDGNAGTNNDSAPFYPANYNLDNLISVAATTNDDARASFSKRCLLVSSCNASRDMTLMLTGRSSDSCVAR